MIGTRSGGCSCGAVRYTVTGEPTIVGICHCTLCRKETGSVFMAYADWPRAAFTTTGAVKTFEGRSFCPVCGSRLFSLGDDKVEIKIGTLDEAPTGLRLNEEIWVWRREKWLPALYDVEQHEKDPPRVQSRLAGG
jgi:hypothetical protein